MRILKMFAMAVVLATASAASGKIFTYSLLELAQQCDVAFTGTVSRVDKEAATVQVEGVIHGKLDVKSVSVKPTTLQGCIGESPNFLPGQRVLVFGKHTEGQAILVVAGGQGKITLDPKTSEMQIAAARRMLEIAAMKGEHERNLAMLDEATSSNSFLRACSLRYISISLAYSKLRERYKERLVSLLGSDDPNVQRAGLNGLRFVDSKDVVPRMIELTGSEDVSLVHSASLALARYDTPEAVARLIELTRHERPDVRCRACIDLSHSRRPEAKAALAAALDDKVPSVRAAASTGLIEMLRAGSADDLLRKLAVLLKDEDVKVASNAAYAIGESRNPWGIEPLLEALQRKDISQELQYAVLGALYCHYNKDDAPEVKPRVEKHIDLVISALKNDDGKVGFGPAFHAVGILNQCNLPEATAALKWAAKSHPNAEIRGYAQSAIRRR